MRFQILVMVPNRKDATSFYRGYTPLRVLQRQMNQKGIYLDFIFDNEYDHGIMSAPDLIFMQRPFRSTDLSVAKLAKSNCVPVWMDFDDDLFSVPMSNPTYKIYGGDDRRKIIAECAAHADVITVTTQALKEKFESSPIPLCKDIRVIPNAFNDALLSTERPIKKERNGIVFWRGSSTHHEDIDQYLEPIQALMEKHPKWTFVFQGDKYWRLFEKSGKNAVFSDGIDPIQYFKMLKDLRPMVTWVPLMDNVFNRCKSNIAWIESTFSGGVTVGPNWEQWQKPGCLNYKDQKTFFDATEAVITQVVNVEEQNKLAWEYMMDNIRLTELNKLRMQVIEDLAAKRNAKTSRI